MSGSNVLLMGLGGLGVEIAKNVCLAGVKSVTLWDPQACQMADLSAQYYLSEGDVLAGRGRAEASLAALAALNDYVAVHVLPSGNDNTVPEEVIRGFGVVVMTEGSLEEQLRVDGICHAAGIPFIAADCFGLFSSVFCDFGPAFQVHDQTGEPAIRGHVGTILAGADADGGAIVTLADDARHGLEAGDFVRFHEVKGAHDDSSDELEGAVVPVKVMDSHSFRIPVHLSSSRTGGQFEQVKQPRTMAFRPLCESLASPEFMVSDWAKMGRSEQLHVGIQALHRFRAVHGAMPRPRCEADAMEVIALAREIDAALTLDEAILKELAFQARGMLCAMATVLGGFVAQEVLKACTGKFTPLRQHLYFDALEALPSGGLSEADCAPTGSRYDAQIAVLGRSFHERLSALRIFVVGAGAIGCELLKVFGMMGIGSGPAGMIHVTDMDNIEKSNLNRQFLFRPADVSRAKSTAAASAVEQLNPRMAGHIGARTDRVGPETEDIFDDAFFEALDFVANALDNVEARKYMDRRAVYYQRPLLESGTLGTKGNTQVVLPHLTESYSSSQDPPERSIPVCTLHHFPNALEHTIEWALDNFQGTFRMDPETANRYLSQPADFAAAPATDKLETVLRALVLERPVTFAECITWARLRFEALFAHNIRQLLHSFPEDAKTREGSPFWAPPKRAPHPLAFDPADPAHLAFVMAAANLRAANYGLKGDRRPATFLAHLPSVIVPDFVPRSGVKIETDPAGAAPASAPSSAKAEDEDVEGLLQALPDPASLVGFRLCPADFEKDDDSNHHIDYIAAAANLRAANYNIAPGDRHTIKGIAGKIIPAIATTTAVVAGLVGLEALKVADSTFGHEHKPSLERFKNGFVNLALPFLAFSEPIAAPAAAYGPPDAPVRWTLWDCFTVPDQTLAALLDHFRTAHGLSITMLSHGQSMLYGLIRDKAKLAERLAMPLSRLVETVAKKPLPSYARAIVLEMLAEDAQGEDVEVPYIRLVLDK
jgi:ubiquitin-activating enzyme E1